MPVLKYNRDMLDTLHFFVYNTHNLFMYNFRTHSYRSYVVNIKIPANFMSVENLVVVIFVMRKIAAFLAHQLLMHHAICNVISEMIVAIDR